MVDLRDDPAAIDTYRHYHRRVWPEVVESLRRVGVREMDIHLLGRRVVMSVELEPGARIELVFAAHVASSPRVAEWERLMKSLQQPVPGAQAGEWWAMMEPVFRLEEQGLAAVRSNDPLRSS
jgi:L-rhamnose mutarotase